MINLDRYALHQAIRTLITGLIAIFISSYFFSSQNYWVILSAIFLVQVRLGYLVQYHILSQLFCGLIAAIFIFVSSYIGNNTFLLAILLSITSFISVYLGFRYVSLFLPAYLVNLLVMISGGLVVSFSEAWMRLEFVLCGMAIAMLVTVLVWPNILRFKIKSIMSVCLKTNLQLVQVIFDIYLKKDYSIRHFFYEKKIYYLSRLFSYYMNIAKDLNEHLSKKNCSKKIARIDRVFEIVMGLGALRYRVKDHTTFGIVNLELKGVLSALINKFNFVILGVNVSSEDQVEANIDRLDEVYRSALQVASQEPLVYLFFIWALKALNEELNE